MIELPGVLVLLLALSIPTVGSDPTPADQGLAGEPPAAAESPAMRGFFLGGSLPEAARRNATGDPLWDLVGRPVPQEEIADGGRGAERRRRAALLAAGVACGAAGIGLLAAAAAVYVAQRRRAERRRNPEALRWAGRSMGAVGS